MEILTLPGTGPRRRSHRQGSSHGLDEPEPELELEVGAVAGGGGCVARDAGGRVVFVRHSLPGERVRARITSATATFARADAVEVIAPSPDPSRASVPVRRDRAAAEDATTSTSRWRRSTA